MVVSSRVLKVDGLVQYTLPMLCTIYFKQNSSVAIKLQRDKPHVFNGDLLFNNIEQRN